LLALECCRVHGVTLSAVCSYCLAEAE
jgi:hypothetical protein